MRCGESLYVTSILACGTGEPALGLLTRWSSPNFNPKCQLVAQGAPVCGGPGVFSAGAPPFGFKGGMLFIPSRRDEAGSWLAGNLHSRERLGKLDLRCGSIA